MKIFGTVCGGYLHTETTRELSESMSMPPGPDRLVNTKGKSGSIRHHREFDAASFFYSPDAAVTGAVQASPVLSGSGSSSHTAECGLDFTSSESASCGLRDVSYDFRRHLGEAQLRSSKDEVVAFGVEKQLRALSVDYVAKDCSPDVSRSLEIPCREAPHSAPTVREPRKGQGYRKLWEQVTKVTPGQKLGEGTAGAFSDMTVEDLIKIISGLSPNESALQAVAQGLQYLDSSATAALLKELCRQGMPKRAVEIFDWLRGLSEDHELRGLCDVYTYTTMVSQCGSHQHLRRALELVAEMRSRGIKCNVRTYTALMNVCIKANEMELALDVYAQMLQEGCTPNLVTFNTLIDIYGKTGQLTKAIDVLDTLDRQVRVLPPELIIDSLNFYVMKLMNM